MTDRPDYEDAAAVGLRWIGRDHAWERFFELGSCEQRGLRGTPWPRRMTIAPDRVAPIDDLTVRIEIGLDLDRHRRAKRRVGHLIRPRPLYAHRPPGCRLCQQHGIERDVVGGVVSVAAGALYVLDRDVLGGNFQNQREIVTFLSV